jgi:hypothetical protein
VHADTADVCAYTQDHHPAQMASFGLLSDGTDVL